MTQQKLWALFFNLIYIYMNEYIFALVKSCFLQLRDFHLYYGLPKYPIHCLQNIQNIAARM